MQSSKIIKNIEPVINSTSLVIENEFSYLPDKFSTSNKLLNLGQPILLLCTKIIQGYYPNEIYILKNNIIRELKIFTDKCNDHNIDKQTSSIALYILSNTTRDILASKNIEFDITEYLESLLEPFSDILNKILKEIEENIELLELIFVCYKLGFTDNDKIEQQARFEHVEHIYYSIIKTKGEISEDIYDEAPERKLLPSSSRINNSSTKIYSFIGLTSLCIILVGWILLGQHYDIVSQQFHITLDNIEANRKNE